jgi:hypothetical protein
MPASRQNIAGGYNLTERRFDGLTTNCCFRYNYQPSYCSAVIGHIADNHRLSVHTGLD